jgi:hypothetical protein
MTATTFALTNQSRHPAVHQRDADAAVLRDPTAKEFAGEKPGMPSGSFERSSSGKDDHSSHQCIVEKQQDFFERGVAH